MIFCSQLSNEFPSGEKWMKRSASLDIAVALFNVDYGTTLADDAVRGQQSGWACKIWAWRRLGH